jgi:uncharacterized DUF497 family protein
LGGSVVVTDDDGDLEFCWDDSKAASNEDKHGIPFELATFVFGDPMRLERTDTFSEGEYRTVVTGKVDGKLLTVVYAAPTDTLVRIISARLATASERDDYEQNPFHS